MQDLTRFLMRLDVHIGGEVRRHMETRQCCFPGWAVQPVSDQVDLCLGTSESVNRDNSPRRPEGFDVNDVGLER